MHCATKSYIKQVLLAYRVLEREARQHGLPLTTQRIIARLQSLDVIVTECWDSSCLYRLTALDAEQQMIMPVLAQVIADMLLPRSLLLPLSVGLTLTHPLTVNTPPPLSFRPLGLAQRVSQTRPAPHFPVAGRAALHARPLTRSFPSETLSKAH
jgi:hypothetical protein